MKQIIILLLLLLPFASFCQKADSAKTKKMQIGLSYSSDYCYRKLKSDNASNKWMEDDSLNVPKLGYSVGLNFMYSINKKVSLEAGVLFSDKGTKTKKYYFGNPGYGDLPANNIFIFHYYYMDVPVKANYYILTGKFKLFVTGGISTNIALTQRATSIMEYGNRTTATTKSTIDPGFSRFNFAALAGCGIFYPITNRVNLKVEPVFKHSINSITTISVKNYLYSYGLNLGVYYNL
jgi:hypothetical protein